MELPTQVPMPVGEGPMAPHSRSDRIATAALAARMAIAAAAALVVTAASPGMSKAQDPQGIEFEAELVTVFETDSLYFLNAVVSPDEQWIVISAGPDLAQYSLYAVPVQGGDLRRLTDGGFHDTHPQWSPDGRYIYFVSDRVGGPSGDHRQVHRIPFDSASGEATDVPRPVSLDSANQRFSISPDGLWLAFFSPSPEPSDLGGELRVVPSSGGASTALARTDGANGIAWSADGERVTYGQRDRQFYREEGGSRYEIWQVGRDGGPPEMLTGKEGRLISFHHGGEMALWSTTDPEPYSSRDHFITDLSGEVLASFSFPEEVRISNSGWSSTYLAPHTGDSGMPMFILPLHGGDKQVVSGFGVEGDPNGWMPDGRLLVNSWTELSDTVPWDVEKVYFAFDPTSRSLSHIPAFDGFKFSFGDIAFEESGGRALIFEDGYRHGGERGSGSVLFLDMDTGERRTLVEVSGREAGVEIASTVYGRGGQVARDGGAFHYMIWQPDHRDLYRVESSGDPELVWTFHGPSPHSMYREQVAIHGDRIAWVAREPGDSVGRSGPRLMLGNLNTREEKELYFRTEGQFDANIIWSNDGTKLAVGYIEEGNTDLAFVEVSQSGEMVGDLKVVRLGTRTWYNLHWLPEDHAIALLAMGLGSDIDTEILLVNVSGEEGDPYRILTEDDPYSVWVFSLSPDGRHIAYGSERPATATLYRMRIPDLGGR